MRDIVIQDYIGSLKELTAAEVRALPEGTGVLIHKFSQRGEHVMQDALVVRSGKKKLLRTTDWYNGTTSTREIRPTTDRVCYTEVG